MARTGTVHAEFAGSVADAKKFAEEYKHLGFHYAPHYGSKPNGLPTVSIKWRSEENATEACQAQIEKAILAFGECGWDREFLSITNYQA